MSLDRIINNPDLVVDDMLRGWLAAHAGSIGATAGNPRVVKRNAAPEQGKVGVVTGGGSGHEPAFLGYVGDGLLDAVAIGEIFSSPTARSFLDAMRAADGGAGVACLYGNYAGDNMNVKMAVQMAAEEGITVHTVVANDDVPSAPRGDEARRRGVAGEILMWKVGAAKAALGGSLEQVIAVAQKAIACTRSIGIGLSACVIPAVGHANFEIAHGSMEVGIGHHGEPGTDVRRTASAAEMAELMLRALLPDLPFERGQRVGVLISGLGATPLMEQYILYGEVAAGLQAHGIEIAFRQIGNLFTSLEMMGVTLTLIRLDDELAALLDAPCQSVGLTVSGDAAPPRGQSAGRVAQPELRRLPPGRRPAPDPVAAVRRRVEGDNVRLDDVGGIVRDLIAIVVANRQCLSDLDGLIGDGDHGINMAKGFSGCGARLDALGERATSLPVALEQLAQALMDDIGGSMGPLYGHFFRSLAGTMKAHSQLDGDLFGEALVGAIQEVQALGSAQVGDKTLIDTLVPAREAFLDARRRGANFGDALGELSAAAEAGRDSTRALQARVGRSARLGARSIGVLDAGATSCCLILQTLASSLRTRLGDAAT